MRDLGAGKWSLLGKWNWAKPPSQRPGAVLCATETQEMHLVSLPWLCFWVTRIHTQKYFSVHPIKAHLRWGLKAKSSPSWPLVISDFSESRWSTAPPGGETPQKKSTSNNYLSKNKGCLRPNTLLSQVMPSCKGGWTRIVTNTGRFSHHEISQDEKKSCFNNPRGKIDMNSLQDSKGFLKLDLMWKLCSLLLQNKIK